MSTGLQEEAAPLFNGLRDNKDPLTRLVAVGEEGQLLHGAPRAREGRKRLWAAGRGGRGGGCEAGASVAWGLCTGCRPAPCKSSLIQCPIRQARAALMGKARAAPSAKVVRYRLSPRLCAGRM